MFNLMLQVLPYSLFALFAAVSTGAYVVYESERRRTGRRLRNVPTPLATKPEVFAVLPVAPTAEPNQILRLHQLGIAEAHIASALHVSLQEVQILVGIARARAVSSAAHEIRQPDNVE